MREPPSPPQSFVPLGKSLGLSRPLPLNPERLQRLRESEIKDLGFASGRLDPGQGKTKRERGRVWGLKSKCGEKQTSSGLGKAAPGAGREGLETRGPGEQVQRAAVWAAFFLRSCKARAGPGLGFPRAPPPAESKSLARGGSRGWRRVPRLRTERPDSLGPTFLTRPSVLFPIRFSLPGDCSKSLVSGGPKVHGRHRKQAVR